MAPATPPTSGRRPPLSRERIARAAVELADDLGISGVTMRRVAESLGVEAMSLYHHVANKDDLLAAMVDEVFAEIDRPTIGGPWVQELRQRTHSAREVLLRHRWAIGLMDSRPLPGPHTLTHHDAVIGCLRVGGLTAAMAAHAFSTIDSYLYGSVLQEVSLPFEGPEDLTGLAEGITAAFPEGAYPHFMAFAVEHALAPSYSHADEFGWGLDLVLDALEQAVDADA
jgi:AcrR family transcriptional regulator